MFGWCKTKKVTEKSTDTYSRISESDLNLILIKQKQLENKILELKILRLREDILKKDVEIRRLRGILDCIEDNQYFDRCNEIRRLNQYY